MSGEDRPHVSCRKTDALAPPTRLSRRLYTGAHGSAGRGRAGADGGCGEGRRVRKKAKSAGTESGGAQEGDRDSSLRGGREGRPERELYGVSRVSGGPIRSPRQGRRGMPARGK